MINDTSEQATDERPSMPRMLQSAMMRCTTRRDIGAQEVQHLNMQEGSIYHNLSFAKATTQRDSVELIAGSGGRPRIRRDLLTAYSERFDAQTWPHRAMLPKETLRQMSYAEFAMTFYVGTDGLIKRFRGSRNRVIIYRTLNYSDPRGDNYPDYCRRSLVTFHPWQGCHANGWGGAEGDVAGTDDVDKRQAMVSTWTTFAEETLLLPYAQRPPGFSAVDLRPAPRRPRRRRRRRVGGSTGKGGTDDRETSDRGRESDGEEDEPNLDGVYGGSGARPGDLSERRRWHDSADHDWGRNDCVGQAGVPEEAESW